MAAPRLAAPLVLPRLVHLRFYLIMVITISITAVCWWRWPPEGGFESASLAIASLCTTLCIPSTLLLINAHIQAWERPLLQLCVVRILLMVPIYAVDAWLGLMQRGSDSARDLIDTVRECRPASSSTSHSLSATLLSASIPPPPHPIPPVSTLARRASATRPLSSTTLCST